MGYISTEQIAEVRNEIKKVLTSKDGFKFSIKRVHYSTISVKLLKSGIEVNKPNGMVNHYYLENIQCKNTKTIFQLIDKAITRVTGGSYDRNAGDMGADYCNCNFYIDYSIDLN
jgi:hypothetical protein